MERLKAVPRPSLDQPRETEGITFHQPHLRPQLIPIALSWDPCITERSRATRTSAGDSLAILFVKASLRDGVILAGLGAIRVLAALRVFAGRELQGGRRRGRHRD